MGVRPAVFGLLVLVAGAAGCFHPQGQGPGPDNPQLIIYRTEDHAAQVVVKGAFKEREYDRIRVSVDDAVLAELDHAYLVGEKLNRTTFNITVSVVLDQTVYRYEAALSTLSDGRVQVSEPRPDAPPRTETRTFPITKILEEVPRA